jgi:hypothetical protein
MRITHGIGRRGFLRLGAALPGALFLPPGLAAATAAPAAEADRRLFLFVDWYHVKKGQLNIVVDPAKVTADGKKLIESLNRDFKRTFEEGPEARNRDRDCPYGVRIAQEPAEKSKPWLVADRPWEESANTAIVLRDQGRYRCWYVSELKKAERAMTISDGRGMELSGSLLAYAESADGWAWEKPALDVLAYAGSRKTNLVTQYHNGGCVFRDDHGPPEERYKTFHFDALPKAEVRPDAPSRERYGLYGVSSPDGYRWTKRDKPLVRYFCDTTNIAAWDPLHERYTGFFRHHVGGGRAISHAVTKDFWDWPAPQPILYSDPHDAPADDYYTNGYTVYPDDPSLRLLFVAVYHRNTDLVDVRAGLSRDGMIFQWLSYEPIIAHGGNGEWDGGAVYAAPNLVHLPDGRLALPFSGYSTTHNEAWYRSFYGAYPSRAAGGWAIWRDGRLAGIEARDVGGFTTQAATFSGSRIELNARTTRSGGIRVELRESGRVVPGYAFADAVPFHGDETWAECRWRGKEGVGALAGKKLEIAFELTSAKIFACRFA